MVIQASVGLMTAGYADVTKPSNITDQFWVWVRAPSRMPYEEGNAGKWQVFVDREHVDESWSNVAAGVLVGELGPSAKVSTARPNPDAVGGSNLHVLIVYAADWRDISDLRRILRKLREIGLAQGWVHFKRDRETRAGAYTVRGHKGVCVWNAPPGVDEITTKWVSGKPLTVTDENESEVVAAIVRKDMPLV